MEYNALFSKGNIGKVTVRNRSVMSPMGTETAGMDGEPSIQTVRYYEERARGGIGLIITEFIAVDDQYGIAVDNQLRLTQNRHVKSFEKLTEAVHRHNAKIFAQLYHGGNMCDPNITGNQNVSASNVATYPSRIPRPLEVLEIKELVQKFIASALRAQKAGFDGVEVHAAHGYLLAQFLSKYYNKRTDEYGGSFDNRIRFLHEIVSGIRAAVGTSFAITVRFSGDEMAQSLSSDHMTLDDGVRVARYLEATGSVNALNISNGNAFFPNPNCDPYSYQPGWKKYVAKTIKEAVSLPVIATNTIKTPDFAEQMLQEGVCDFVGLGRSQLADPEFMKKAKQGREKEIRECIGCMYCRETMGTGVPIRCAINPRLANEYVYTEAVKNGNRRPVAVVGAGPAGLEAARVLAERNFRVTLFEKKDKVGGTLNLADKPRFKDRITRLTETLKIQAEKAGVEIVLNTEATPEVLKRINPVGVFLSSGAVPIIPNIPGNDLPSVCTAESVIENHLTLAGSVAIIGAGMTGLETAEFLGEKGSALTIVEMLPTVGAGLFPVIRNDILGRLNEFHPAIYTGYKLVGIDEEGITLKNLENEKAMKLKVDHVVLSLGVSPRQGYIEVFEKEFDPVIAIGDASKTGRIYQAMKDGFTKAYVFDPD